MSTITKTIFKCDVCNRESEQSGFLAEIEVPARVSDGSGTHFVNGYTKIDMCKECEQMYFDIVQRYFARVCEDIDKTTVQRTFSAMP